MKTSVFEINKLSGAALRYAVAMVLGHCIEKANDEGRYRVLSNQGVLLGSFMADGGQIAPHLLGWCPDKDWAQYGPLADKFQIYESPWYSDSRLFMALTFAPDPLSLKVSCIGLSRHEAGCRLLVKMLTSEYRVTFEAATVTLPSVFT